MAFMTILLFIVFALACIAQECYSASGKEAVVERLLAAKAASNKSFDEIAAYLGLTNAYVAQLFVGQAQLKPATAIKLKEIVPDISDSDLAYIQKPANRSFDPLITQEPFVFRLIEAIQHYGQGLKLIANEKKGDGIISAIDLYVSLDEVKGVHDEDRLVVTFNGKWLKFNEQFSAENTAAINA